jgi:ketosteroid isomerase-like protein
MTDFDDFLAGRDAVGRAYVSGDAEPLAAIAAADDPASFFGPGGGSVSGAGEVLDTHRRGAQSFRPGGESHFEVLHSDSSGDLGYLVAIQHATVNLAGRDDPVPMTLRITELYRREGGDWKLLHRHADSLDG